MKKFYLVLSAISICGLFTFASASDAMIEFQIGPLWPKVLTDSEKPTAWNASLQLGKSIDRVVAMGIDIGFLWNKYTEEKQITGNTYRVDSEEKTYGIPLSFFLSITPLPDFIVYPEISGQIGFNNMYYSKNTDLIGEVTSELFDESGWYMGVIGNVGAAAHFAFSNNATIFAGVDYTWSNLKKVSRNSNKKSTIPDQFTDGEFPVSIGDDLITRRNMSGFGINFGLRLFM